jgi:hypothetical protein
MRCIEVLLRLFHVVVHDLYLGQREQPRQQKHTVVAAEVTLLFADELVELIVGHLCRLLGTYRSP